ncbi:MAG: exosortase system-associated protein, TIGR04073 family [Planctomycetota bacterium]
MRSFLIGLVLAVMASPVMAQSTTLVNDEPPHIGPSETENVVGKMTGKLARGFVNILTCIGEIPNQMVKMGHDKGFWAAISLGFLKGLGMFVVRFAAGAFDMVFFLSPWPDDWKPILEPEYVWE